MNTSCSKCHGTRTIKGKKCDQCQGSGESSALELMKRIVRGW